MRTYIRGEVIEVEVSKIGILLEGFVKQEGKDDVIGAPAGLHNLVLETTHRGMTSTHSQVVIAVKMKEYYVPSRGSLEWIRERDRVHLN